mmetsp:Transcript_5321/g.11567  ORF Transcript_5321/g.11567 Transcript_5321/m.11567 type:complete len:285 (-) Transcript_5321:136-990(-)|eukprot:CAMPEP_0206582292 /NCGR_PEP_ID=MMETSP0325_2-20121206/34381_1 /ASSEMBLY_ACC=CAM_ASM_000347 /TAXON_ID=2866 /ORGANISM="Crypthecodinium cohnii, Strain Seligo" /LENGTH=284 /DNA_ID=CAMNT_0054088913 /DNA_START=60 /DNA_END=914 /DNA_ORIENTATION=-
MARQFAPPNRLEHHGYGNTVRPDLALQGEADMLQAVYMREQRELEVLARELGSKVQEIKHSVSDGSSADSEQAVAAQAPGSTPFSAWSSATAATPSQGSDARNILLRHVRWTVEGAKDFPWSTPTASFRVEEEFDLPELPGAHFKVGFSPFGGDAKEEVCRVAMGSEDLPPWLCTLEVTGLPAATLVQASLEVEAESVTVEGSSPSSSSSNGNFFMGRMERQRSLTSCAPLKLVGAWPAGAAEDTAFVMCSLELLAELPEKTEVLVMVSDWDAIASPVTACLES